MSDYAVSTLPALPPLAISFFTFEFVHYLYEVLKGGKPITSPFRFAAFAIFFPSLVAGPIKRYQQFLPSLESGLHNTDLKRCASGLVLVAVGFFKKLVIADN
ncbi:MAG TPA: MBOAT family O-acyltransferase, partial [Candidatus Melainabacteria bacterium]|nr:MBOAT family O-acyltransferase [Candidatus Melainabacteria bacterium]